MIAFKYRACKDDKDAKGTGQWHSEGTSDILRTIKMEVDAFEIKV